MDIRVLLIAQDDTVRKEYLSAIEKYAVQVFVSESFQDLSREICGQSYHGIFLDLHTKMKAINKNKNLVYGLVENYPVCQLKFDDQTGEINCFYHSQKLGGTLVAETMIKAGSSLIHLTEIAALNNEHEYSKPNHPLIQEII